jgi:hypothetical protein
MKFRSSLQVFRSDNTKEDGDGARPATATYFRIPGTRSMSKLPNELDEQPQTPTNAKTKGTPAKAMQGFLQRTGAGLKATGANLKARGAKLERRIPRKRAKVRLYYPILSSSGHPGASHG